MSVSVLRCSELIGARRIDAEAYRPELLEAIAVLEKLPHVRLEPSVAFVTDGQHGYHEIDETSEIKHLTAQCIRNGHIEVGNADRISSSMHARNQRSACQVGDVLISTAGTVGNSGVVTSDVLPANMDQDVARIKILNQQKVNPWYVATFLNSTFGRLQTSRETTGQVQQHLALEKVRKLRIPIFPTQDSIAERAQQSFEMFQQAKLLYADAQNLLIGELGLDKLDLTEGAYSVRQFSDVADSRRADGEYFLEKYDRILTYLNERDAIPIHDVAKPARRRFLPPVSGTFQYLEIGDVNLSIATAEATELSADEAPSRAQWIVHANDVIVSMVRPIRGGIAIIRDDQHGHVCSSGFTVLEPTAVEPEYLAAWLKTKPMRELLDRETTATMYPAVSTEDVLGLPIPLLSKGKRSTICKLVRDSHAAHQCAKALLHEAKAEVERLIEGLAKGD